MRNDTDYDVRRSIITNKKTHIDTLKDMAENDPIARFRVLAKNKLV